MPWHESHPIARRQALLVDRERQPQVNLKEMPPDTAEALLVAAIDYLIVGDQTQ